MTFLLRPSFILLLGTCAAPFARGQQQPSWQSPPKLVVGIVVDQMRTDYIYRYWDNFGEGGFKRLIGEGAFLRDAHYNYMPTVTGPGHASIYTGTTPSRHGIVANEMYDRGTRKTYYCVNDTSMTSIGTATTSGRRSPHLLLASTIADELELRFDRRSKTIGVALKDRSAILPIGRMGDAAYWFSGGAFITSSWYGKELPPWMAEFNAKKPVDRYMTGQWDLVLPRERYHEVLPDANPYESPVKSGMSATLPIDLDSIRLAGAGADVLPYTPWGNTITTDAALAAIEGEALGADDATDLLAISYSSPDLLGHRMGPRALEIEDMYIRLDREVKNLLDQLDERVGAGQYTVFLTADHGVVDVPAFLKDFRGSAGYVDISAKKNAINAKLQRFSDDDSVMYIGDGEIFLAHHGRPARLKDLSNAFGLISDTLYKDPEIATVISGPLTNVLGNAPIGLAELQLNGYMAGRSGDIQYSLKPGYFEAEGAYVGKGTTHGSGWTYDTHVPVIFFGKGVQKGEVLRPTEITDIAPTICAIVGMALPNAASGAVVHQVLGSR